MWLPEVRVGWGISQSMMCCLIQRLILAPPQPQLHSLRHLIRLLSSQHIGIMGVVDQEVMMPRQICHPVFLGTLLLSLCRMSATRSLLPLTDVITLPIPFTNVIALPPPACPLVPLLPPSLQPALPLPPPLPQPSPLAPVRLPQLRLPQ